MRDTGGSLRDRVVVELTRRRGDRGWDLLLRITALVAVAAIPATILSGDCGAFAAFALFTIWTNGPYSPVLPAAHEPVLMLYGRFYSPLLVGLVGTFGILVVEVVNYRVYRWAGRLESVRKARDKFGYGNRCHRGVPVLGRACTGGIRGLPATAIPVCGRAGTLSTTRTHQLVGRVPCYSQLLARSRGSNCSRGWTWCRSLACHTPPPMRTSTTVWRCGRRGRCYPARSAIRLITS
jgi:hypothetical protein